VLFVGYQAEHTLGRRIRDGMNPVRIYGEEVTIEAKILRADAYSAHADRGELLSWADSVRDQGSVERWFLVHGEPDAQQALADGLAKRSAAAVEVPERGETFAL